MNSLGKLLDRMERKFGRYAIRNLPLYIVIMYAAGFILSIVSPYSYWYISLNPAMILKGQIWRLFTFLLVPPSGSIIFILFILMFYYSIAQSLENVWGSFRFNVYYLVGVVGTILAAFILYAITGSTGIFMDTYYLNLSLFLAFAANFPDMVVYFMMILPIKVKWLGILDGVYLAVAFLQGGLSTKVSILAAMANFLIFFFATRNYQKFSPKEARRKRSFQKTVHQVHAKEGEPRHRCAICGRTELDNPDLEFRYCSKCDGDYEYCQDHLFTHTHIKK